MQLTRSNRRKTTKYRRTQVIDVPKYIMRNGLNKNDTNMANIIKKRGNPELHPDLFEINKSKWAGRRKFIFHTPQAY